MTTPENPPPPSKPASTSSTLSYASKPSPPLSYESKKRIQMCKNFLPIMEFFCISLILIALFLVLLITHLSKDETSTITIVGIAFLITTIPIGTLVLIRYFQSKLDSSPNQTVDSIAQVHKINILNIIRRIVLSFLMAGMLVVIVLCGLLLLLVSVCSANKI